MFWNIFVETAAMIVTIVLLSWLIFKAVTRDRPSGDGS